MNRSLTRRWFLQSASMGLAASACPTRFGLAAQNGRRIPIRGVIPAALTPFDADLHVALAEAIWRSDLDAARRINDRLFPLTQVFYRPGFDAHTRMKYALTRLGRWQSDAVRPPLTPLDASERALIDRALRESGLQVTNEGVTK